MDPELTEQLNESMRQLSEMIAQLNSTMAGTVSSMKSVSDAGKNAANTTRQNADRQTNSSNQIISGQTKASAAMQQAEEKMSIAFKNVNAALSSTASGLASFSKSMLSAEAGFSKYTGATTSLGDAALSLGRNFGILGTLAGGVIKFFTFFAGDALRLVDNLVQFRDETTKVTGVLPTTLEGLEQLSRNARFSGESMLKLQKITAGLGTSLVSLGGIAGTGAVKFMQMADVSDGLRRKFGLLGVSQERLAELQSLYVKHQTASGTQYSLQNKSMEQLRKESLSYADNMTRLSALTGEQAEDIEKQQAIVQMQLEEQVQVRSENARIRQLEKSGREEDKQEAAKIRAEQRARKAVLDEATARMGPEMSAQLGRIIRTGGYDAVTGPLATLGIDFTALSQKVKNARGMSEEDAAKYGQQIAGQLTNNMQDAYDRQTVALGTAIQYGGKELADSVGVYGETLGKLAQTEGKTAEELAAMEKAARAKAEQDAGLAKEEENRRKMERELQAEYQKALMPIAKQLLPFITSLGWKMVEALKWAQSNMDLLSSAFKVAIGVMGVLVGATALGGVVNLFKNLLGAGSALKSLFGIGSGKLGSRGNPMHVTMDGIGGGGPAQRAARAAIDDSQLLDKNGKPLRGAAREARAAKLAREAAAATSAPARTGILGKAGGMLGKAGGMLGKAGKLIPGVGWLMTAGMAAAEGVSAYNDAANVMGIKGRDATTGEKLTAGAAGALSSLTFGLVDTKTIAGGLSKTFEVLGSVMGPVIETGKSVVSTVFSPFVSTGKLIAENWDAIYSTGASIVETVFSPFLAVGRLITENWESIYSIGKSMVGVIGDLIKIAFYPLIAVGRLIKNNWDSIVSVGKQVVNVVFWPFIQVGKVVYNNWDKIASAFKTGLGYLASFWGKIKDFTGWLSSWLGGDDEEKPDEEKPDEEKPAPATPQKELPKPEPAKTEEETTDRPGVAPKEDETAISESTFTTATRDLVTTQQENEETNQGVRSEQNKAFSDIVKRFDESVVQTTKNTKINTNAISDFSSSNRLFQKLTNTFNLTVNSFSQSISSFVLAVKDFGDKISQMALGTGQPGPGANAPATVEAAMQMQFQKESGGGKMLRAQGFKHAGTMGGAYGLGDGARKSAYDSMNKQERAEFLAKTGFAKAPTLNDLVSKDGKSFLSDQARVADEMLARKYTMNTIQSLNQKLGRAPTMADVRGAHWLGEGGYVALLKAAAENPNMTMRDFWKPSWGSVDLKQFPPTVGEMIAKIAEQAGGFGGGTLGNSADIVALGKQLQGMGIRVSEHPEFKPFNPKGHEGRAHAEGRALDLNVVDGRDVDDQRAAQIFDNLKPQLMSQGYSVLWRVGGHYDHMHVQKGADGIKPGTDGIVAAKGGVFEGSREGYPATLHGTELVAPLNVDSILMKMAKTPATAAEPTEQENTKISGFVEPAKLVEQLMSKDNEMLMLLSSKLDQMIDALENSNDTQSKILKHSRI